MERLLLQSECVLEDGDIHVASCRLAATVGTPHGASDDGTGSSKGGKKCEFHCDVECVGERVYR